MVSKENSRRENPFAFEQYGVKWVYVPSLEDGEC
jgi:hypothetical protein